MTAQDIINAAFRILSVKGSGENVTFDEANDALAALNTLLDSWSADNLCQLGLKTEGFTLTPGTPIYTIGIGQTFNTPIPVTGITSAFMRDINNYDYPVKVITQDEYYSLTDVAINTSTALPYKLFYDPGLAQQTSPAGTIYVYPAPDQAYTLFIESEKYFTNFVALTDAFTFPPYFERALKYALANEIAPEYGTDLSASAYNSYLDAMRIMKTKNSRQLVSQTDFPSRRIGGNNPYTFGR